MAGIHNINSVYGISNRRAVGKISFNVGDRFNGRIVKKIEPASAVIRLGEGLDFEVDVDGNLEDLKEGIAKFEVTGFKDGKLQLKVIYSDAKGDGESKVSLNSNSLLADLDKEIVEGMMKFNIPLSKENIKNISSIVQFLNKINNDSSEIDEFISKYISSNNIHKDNIEVSNLLKSFMKEFKTLNTEDILFFIENNIEFDEEAIKSFNNIVKSNINSLESNIESLKNEEFNKIEILRENKENAIKIEKNNTEVETTINKKNENNINDKFIKNIYEKQDQPNKINVLSILKTIAVKNNNMETNIEKINNNEALDIQFLEKNKPNIHKEIAVEILKEVVNGDNSIVNIKKVDVEKAIGKIINKDIELSQEEFKNIKEAILDNDIIEKVKDAIKDEIKPKELELVQKEIKNQIKNKGDELQDILKKILNEEILENEDSAKIISFLKENISDIKMLNKINNEYYFFQSNLKLMEKDYPCKLIIKDDRKNGKKIDSTNVKMIVSVKTINLGEIDAYINVIEKNMNIDFKCEKNYINSIESIKNKLYDAILKTGYIPKINVKEKDKEVNLVNCRSFFSQNNRTNLDIKV